MTARASKDAPSAAAKPRGKRGGGPKSRVVRLRVVEAGAEYPEGVERPRTRGDCANVPRPCPFVGCRANLYLEVVPPNKRGRREERLPGLRFNFPDLDVTEMKDSCALDAADRGGMHLDDIGEALGISRQGVDQQVSRASIKLAHKTVAKHLMLAMREREVESQERKSLRK